jgi:glycosidase
MISYQTVASHFSQETPMAEPRSVREIDFRPIRGKRYWSCEREWREEFIYFLMVDRFHDGRDRRPVSGTGRSRGGGAPEQLRRFCGGTLRGITANLDYVQGLGCTAIWLSPVFENDGAPDPNASTYHGYAIRNYLAIDPRFGTKADLVELVDEAHRRDLRVFLDAVANHAGDVFHYAGGGPRYYRDDNAQHEFGEWTSPDYPVPGELRSPAYFHRRGEIRAWGWDSLPETQWGDFFSLKGFNNDETPEGLALQEILIDAHRYWIREADIDGFRMDAVKHMGEMAVARFCQATREYAYSLGKRDFFLFGELVAGDSAINRYAGPNTAGRVGEKTVFYGLSSVLDFPLYWVLPGVVKGFNRPTDLFNRYDALRERALSRGELGRYLVTFVDNHDQIGQERKQRFAAGADDAQVIAGIGYLLCALGTPCIYYGTEQGFAGEGRAEESVREALFDLDDPAVSFHNRESRIYREIASIARVNREQPALRFGRMYFREVSGNGFDFGLPETHPCTLAFARLLGKEEVLVAYNSSVSEARSDFVVVDADTTRPAEAFRFLYGGTGEIPILRHQDPGNRTRFVRLNLEPMQLVILTRA